MPNCTVSMEVQDLDFAVNNELTVSKGVTETARGAQLQQSAFIVQFLVYSVLHFLNHSSCSESQGAGVSVFQQISGFLKRSSRSGEGQSLLNTPRLLPPAGQAGSQQEELGHCVFISADA